MYNGKFISYKTIIEEIYRDFKFQYVFQVSDAIEWLGSALRQLKIPRYYIDKITDGNKDLHHQDFITISDHRGKLPCDLYSITQTAFVHDCSTYKVLNSEKGCYPTLNGISYVDIDTGKSCTTGDGSQLCSQFVLDKCSCGCNKSNCNKKVYIPMRWNTNTFYKGLHGCTLDYNCNSSYTYTVNNNYIFTSMKEGKVAMAYKAVPTDGEGFPMIPDNESVIQYVKWFIAHKIAFQLYISDKFTESKYEMFDSNLQLYFRKAKNEGKMLANSDEYQSLSNQLIKSIKTPFEHNSFFGNMQAPEIRYNHPYFNSYAV